MAKTGLAKGLGAPPRAAGPEDEEDDLRDPHFAHVPRRGRRPGRVHHGKYPVFLLHRYADPFLRVPSFPQGRGRVGLGKGQKRNGVEFDDRGKIDALQEG